MKNKSKAEVRAKADKINWSKPLINSRGVRVEYVGQTQLGKHAGHLVKSEDRTLAYTDEGFPIGIDGSLGKRRSLQNVEEKAPTPATAPKPDAPVGQIAAEILAAVEPLDARITAMHKTVTGVVEFNKLFSEELKKVRHDFNDAILLLTESIDKRFPKVEVSDLGKPMADAYSRASSAKPVTKFRPPMAPEKIKRPEYIDSEVLLRQLAILAAHPAITAISPGTTNANGVGVPGTLKLHSDTETGVRIRGAMGRGLGITDFYVVCDKAHIPAVREAIERTNDYLLGEANRMAQ